MSRQNKVNPDRYKTGGRLSPDDLARERQSQQSTTTSERPHRGDERPSWMKQDHGAEQAGEAEPPGGEAEAPESEDRAGDRTGRDRRSR